MAATINKMILMGRLGADPDVRYTQSGTAIANFNVATEYGWKRSDGEWENETEWTRIVAMGKLGEKAKEKFGKGDLVYIEGRKRTQTWKDREGEEHTTVECVASYATLIISKSSSSSSGERSRNDNPEPTSGGFTDDDIPF